MATADTAEKLQRPDEAKDTRVDTGGQTSTGKTPTPAANGDAKAHKKMAKLALKNTEEKKDGAGDEHEKGEHEGEEAKDGKEHEIDVSSLSEQDIRKLVFIQDGPNKGKERYDVNKNPPTPLEPKAGSKTEDKSVDEHTWHEARERLEMFIAQHEGKIPMQGEGEDNKATHKDNKVELSGAGEFNVKSNEIFSRSTTNDSRADRSAADQRVDDAKDRLDSVDQRKHDGELSGRQAKIERREDRADLKQAQTDQKGVYDKTKDPIGDRAKAKEAAEKAEEEKQGVERTEASAKLTEAKSSYEAALKKEEAAKSGGDKKAEAEAKAEEEKAKEELKAATDKAHELGVDKTAVSKAYDFLKDHTSVEMKGDFINKTATTGMHGVKTHMHDEEKGILGSHTEGEENLLAAGATAKARVGVGDGRLNADASVGAKAVLAEIKEEMKWEFPGHFLGEEVNTKLFVEVSGMVGVEGKAQIKANLGKMNPKEPRIDTNHVTAGVEAFAGAKVSVGAGAAFEWRKKGPDAYKDKVANAGKVIVDIISASNPPLGFILRRMNGDQAATKLMQFLMSWGATGNVPLIGLEALVEGSAGVGAKATMSAGIKGGHIDFTAQANATWGLGLGGSVKVMLDVLEGPKFALITLGELRPIAIKFAEEKIQQGVQVGSAFIHDIAQTIADWWSAKDKAHELVAHNVPSVLPAQKNCELINSLFGWYCKEDDQRAILEVMRHMSIHGQLGQMPADLKQKIMEKTDPPYHAQAAHLIGYKPWK